MNDDEIIKIRKECGYSTKYSEALIKLHNQSRIEKDRVEKSDQRFIEIVDFVSKSFDPFIIDFIKNGRVASKLTFHKACRFVEQHFEKDYITEEQYRSIFKEYGIGDAAWRLIQSGYTFISTWLIFIFFGMYMVLSHISEFSEFFASLLFATFIGFVVNFCLIFLVERLVLFVDRIIFGVKWGR